MTDTSDDELTVQGKVALVTGGTSGIGWNVARKLVAHGAIAVVNGRNPERCAQAVEELGAHAQRGGRAVCAVGDCGDYASATEVVRAAAAIDGAIDIVVSSGAGSHAEPMLFASMNGNELDAAFTSRFRPRFNPVHAALPFMRPEGGAIVLVGTDAARHTTPGESVIGAFGAAVIAMTKTLAKELAGRKIRVNAMALTLTSDTPTWDRIFADASFQSELFTKALKRFPAGRAPTAEEVARVALFLCSPASQQVTGQTISVNGGLSFGGW